MIIVGRPPNFDLIALHFPKAADAGTVFAFDGNVYAPGGASLSPALIAHETVHLERQEEHGASSWWNRYLIDPDFRYHEELLAHAAEFKMQRASDRNASARLLTSTALRLIAPLYNYQPPRSLSQAMRDLRREIGL